MKELEGLETGCMDTGCISDSLDIFTELFSSLFWHIVVFNPTLLEYLGIVTFGFDIFV